MENSTNIGQHISKILNEVSADNSFDFFEKLDKEAEMMELILALENNPAGKFSTDDVLEVIQYLQSTHKLYLSKKLPEIEQTMVHIFNKHSNSHQTLAALTLFFNNYKNRLVNHIRMEEKEFFPFIKDLVYAHKGNLSKPEIVDLLSKTSLASFDDNHDPIEDELKEVSDLIHEYTQANDMPMPFRVFINQVELFEQELRKHAIIEDHILLPMAQHIENQLKTIHLN